MQKHHMLNKFIIVAAYFIFGDCRRDEHGHAKEPLAVGTLLSTNFVLQLYSILY